MKRIFSLLTGCLLSPCVPSPAADKLSSAPTSHVILAHSKKAARNGEASLISLRDGSLLLPYGAHEKSGDWDRDEIRQVRSRDGGETWSAPTDIYCSPTTDLWVDYPAARRVGENLHLIWRHIRRTRTDNDASSTSLYHHVLCRPTFEGASDSSKQERSASKPLRIMPLGDSITRGSYLAHKDGKPTGLPHPMGGGWRKVLQDKLRTAGVAYDFVGALQYAAFGGDGEIDPGFDPDHHGLAGFGNTGILKGGKVPTPADVLESLGVPQIEVPGIVEALRIHHPDVILMMTGANGFDAAARDRLIRTIGETTDAHLFVATILPQKAPRAGWEKVGDYNASLPAIIAAQKAAGKRITLVDMHAALTAEDLLPDGVHPSQTGMEKMASTWFFALAGELKKHIPSTSPR